MKYKTRALLKTFYVFISMFLYLLMGYLMFRAWQAGGYFIHFNVFGELLLETVLFLVALPFMVIVSVLILLKER